ncbi:UNVERIFIED_CONTAM: hypothetical protein PYX00_006977 [Menopon gallinae]|uniref:Protein-cysteine N-palmitoyltransferase Rasp n=1 Tax=Menopon gallinae TaxID=328185 RepID=A0AAW2HHY5_9NEOP
MPVLSKFETFLYFAIWITGVVLSLYNLHLYGRVFNHNVLDNYQHEDFTKGWKILGERFQDQADYEWNSWTQLIIKLLPFLFCNLVVAELLRRWKKMNLLPLWYIIVSLVFVIYNFNFTICIWFILLAVIYYALVFFNNLLVLWVVTGFILHFFKPDIWFALDEDDQYLVMISSSWMILRCISFCVDKSNELSKSKLSFTHHIAEFSTLLGYSLYLPTMFLGPFIMFSNFYKGINLEFENWTLKRILKNVVRFSRCWFWFLFTEFSLHFVYVNAILLRPHLVQHLFEWELAGLGIAMGHFFHLKYIVFYGLPCAWAAAERFETPEVPCCVSRVHLYSHMWRRFDHGLYQFLVRYIYIPVTTFLKGSSLFRKTPASIACFAFVFAWHGGEMHVFYWVLFNFIAVTIEALGKQLFHLPIVRRFCERRISDCNILRLQCLLVAPLHYFSMVSNFFFIGNGMNIGLVYLNKFFNGSFKSNLIILFFLYGAGQSASAVQAWEEKNRRKQKSND